MAIYIAFPIAQVGLRHLGVDANDGIVVTDADLRDKTRVVAYVNGDVRGEIVVGQVRRIQAGADPEISNVGVISANLTATGATVPTGEIGAGEGAIGYIIAGDLISGNVVSEISKVDRQVAPRLTPGPCSDRATDSGSAISVSSR